MVVVRWTNGAAGHTWSAEEQAAQVTAVDPGYSATDLNDHTGTQSVAEGAEAIVVACTAPTLSAGFISRHGPVPW